MKYFDELKKSMEWLGKKSDTFFIGQAVEVPGTAMFNTVKDIDNDKRLELPVFEDTQMGMSIGMALTGQRIISIFPRWNFLLCATNQLVSHLDKLPTITEGKVNPNLIIRTSVGSQRPLFPGHQHIGNMSDAYRKMLSNVEIIELEEPEDIFDSYKKAYERDDGKSTLLVEFGDYYNEK
jgi:pyruvate/2-oxoglutarate/acetoin dehydrogenase E1 component